MARILVPSPTLQIDFAGALHSAYRLYLQEALTTTVRGMTISEIDAELGGLAPNAHLSSLASHGLRGELVFAVPSVLKARPQLLAYYRLLLGFSQKAFYTSALGLSRFKAMETRGVISGPCLKMLPALCSGLAAAASELLTGLASLQMSKAFLHDLSVLTFGAQLRGGANVKIGTEGVAIVFNIIRRIVDPAVVNATATCIELLNASGRSVKVEFSSDPDIQITEGIAQNTRRNVIAIEIKAGKDYSNVHNRLGEAEKSHQKARQDGFTECWTIVNVSHLNLAHARTESPSTDRFYNLAALQVNSEELTDFTARIAALTGIRNPCASRPQKQAGRKRH